MIKSILKLAVVAVIANAVWHVFVPYSAHFKFTDAVEATTQFGDEKSDEELRARIVELASQYDVPVTSDSFTLKRQNTHTIVDGSYTQQIELFPGYLYPYTFRWRTDTFTQKAPVDSTLPK